MGRAKNNVPGDGVSSGRYASVRAVGALLSLLFLLIAAGPASQQQPEKAATPFRLQSPVVFTQLSQVSTLAVSSEPQARLVRLDPDGSTTVLSDGFFSARDADVSFDGQRILFAAKRTANEYWQVYEMNADGSEVRRVTGEEMDCRQPIYQSTLYVLSSDKPWYQISFLGSSDKTPRNLYSAMLDGTTVRQISFNPYGDADPFLMSDGRILLASRQSNRVEPGERERSALFGLNIDGADYAIFSAEEGAAWKRMPCVTTNGLVVFVENDRIEWDGGGWLAAVTTRRNLHSHRRMTDPKGPRYHSPSPLPDGTILVSRRETDGSDSLAVYRFDPATGAESLVFDSPDYHDIQAKVIAPRPEPDGRSSVVSEQDPTGILYCLNVYSSDLRNADWMPPGTAKRLRVLEGMPRPASGGDGPLPPPARRVLGEIGIETDGSFNIRVPANIPIALQLLDEHGAALRTCSWIWVRNKEPRGCIGCHEDGELTPENRTVDAVIKPSIALTLPPERRWTVTFDKDIRPIFQNKCALEACHGGGVPPRLSEYDDARIHVSGMARTSPLAWHLFGQNISRPWDGLLITNRQVEQMPPKEATPLTDAERRTILEWMDMGAELR